MEASPEKKIPSSILGPRLRQERQRRHLSQEKLAEIIGCDVRSIRRWEQGKGTPDYENRHRLSNALNITLEDFHQLLQLERHERLLEHKSRDATLPDFRQGLPPVGEGDDELIEIDIPKIDILPKSNTIIRGIEEPAKQPVQRRQRRALLKWGGAGIGTTLVGSGLFYWFTRASTSSLSPSPSSLRSSYTYTAPGNISIVDVVWSSKEGNFIACVNESNIAQVIAISANTYHPTYSPESDTPRAINCLAWSPDGKQLTSPSIAQNISQSTNNTIHIWDPLTGYDALYFPYGSFTPESIAWSYDRNSIAVCGTDGAVGTWNATSGTPLQSYQRHKGTVYRVVWSPKNPYLFATAGADGNIYIWNTTKEKEPPLTCKGHTQDVLDADWSPSGEKIVSASKDTNVYIWDAITGKIQLHYTKHTRSVRTVAWSPDGNYIASAGEDTMIRVWDVVTGRDLVHYTDHKSTVRALSWSPDGQYLASASEDGTMQVRYVSIQR